MTGKFFCRLRAGAVCAFVAAWVAQGAAWAAGGAFAVDNAGVDDPGSCKIETWAALARNSDRIFALAGACAVSLGQPVEFGVQADRIRSGGEWLNGAALKAKTSLVPFRDDSRFGAAISGSMVLSLETGKIAAWVANLPVSVRLTDQLQLNLQVGGIWEQVDDRTLFVWGTGLEFAFTEKVSFIGEVFGVGPNHTGAQAGLRFTPHERIDFDVIYGHNLTGDRSDWLTLGMNVRF